MSMSKTILCPYCSPARRVDMDIFAHKEPRENKVYYQCYCAACHAFGPIKSTRERAIQAMLTRKINPPARVLSAEEVDAISRDFGMDGHPWPQEYIFERKSWEQTNHLPVACHIVIDKESAQHNGVCIIIIGGRHHVSLDYYQSEWRIWNSYPTESERNAAKWKPTTRI